MPCLYGAPRFFPEGLSWRVAVLEVDVGLKAVLKNMLRGLAAERVVSEVAVEARVLLLTRLPNLVFPSRRLQMRQAKQLTGIKLNLGSGPLLEPGWVGIDYRAGSAIRCDLKRPLPFKDGACKYIFSEHVLEHFDLRELHNVLSECYRVLEPHGVLRVITPDLKKFLNAYMTNNDEFARTVFGSSMPPAQSLNAVFEMVTHRFIHDFASLRAELLSARFAEVRESDYRKSDHPELNIDCSLPSRTLCSLYVEAIK
jgi:SAM-dependent methyltransferase